MFMLRLKRIKQVVKQIFKIFKMTIKFMFNLFAEEELESS